MSSLAPGKKLLPSVLDRLIDDPKGGAEPDAFASRKLAGLKESVKRDLEWLLNSKRALAEQPRALDHLNHSLLAYGLPDFTTSSLNTSADQDFLLRSVQDAVTRFEPRLTHVRVSLEEPGEYDRSIRFRIEGVLNVEPTPEVVSYDSILQLHTKAFKIEADSSRNPAMSAERPRP